MRRAFGGLVVLVAVAAAGCGGSTHHAAVPTSSTLAAPSSTSSTLPASTTTPPTGSTSTTAPPATIPSGGSPTSAVATGTGCNAGQLEASWPSSGSANGSTYTYTVTFHNTSPQPCKTGGYVGVSSYSLAGKLIASQDTHTGGATPTLTVAPGGSVAFDVGFKGDGQNDGGAACGGQRVGSLHLIPPNETSSDQVATTAGGTYPAMCGTALYVGPLRQA